MTIERKVGMGIAGQPSGATDVAEVFSTHLYTGTGSAGQTIDNGIDLAGKGGLVWLKLRDAIDGHLIYDTERGANKYLSSNTNYGETNQGSKLTSFNSNGFTYGGYASGYDVVSWTFRKKEKFFDVVTWTGNDVSGRTIAHGLDGPVGMIIAKRTNASQDWVVWHKDLASTKYLKLNSTAAEATSTTIWTSTAPTSTVFSVGDGGWVNGGGSSYVAYVFADNSSEDAEEQMIKCGSYVGNGSADGPVVNLGWEPQFVLIKSVDYANQWIINDTMRSMSNGADDALLTADSTAAESAPFDLMETTSTGFKLRANWSGNNRSGITYIYTAIRGEMMVEPKAATDVFAIDTRGSTGDGLKPAYRSGFPVDLAIRRSTGGSGGNVSLQSRLTGGGYFRANTTNPEAYDQVVFDYNNGYGNVTDTNASFHSYMWKRAKGFFDVVAYTGTGSNRTLPHSLSVIPEMIWVKSRSNVKSFGVYHPSSHAAGNTIFIDNDHAGAGVGSFQSTAVSATTFNVDTAEYTNESGWTYIAFLFASLDGISKVGSYTGNGSSQTIACGFSAGARFILIKRIGVAGDWFFWDSVRGIVAGNDPHFSLNTTATHVTTDDSVDPHNSGFIVNQDSATDINVSSGTYIFYAIA
jgi:hypothetical protein